MNLELFRLGKIFYKFRDQVRSKTSKAIMLSNLVSFFYRKNATSNPLGFLWSLAMIPEKC